MSVSGGFNFLIGNGWKFQFFKDLLQCPGSLVPDLNNFFFRHRLEAPINLIIPLQHQVVVVVVYIMGGAGKHVVIVGNGTVARENIVSAGKKLPQETGGITDG